MRKNQRQNKRTLLKEELFANVSHADEQRGRQRKGERKLAQTRGLVGIEGVAFAGEVAEREDKKDGSNALINPPMFRESFLPSALRHFLELHFGSESENYGALCPSAHVRVILNDRLKKDHG